MSIVCLDLGGTKLAIGRVTGAQVDGVTRLAVPQQADYDTLLQFLQQALESVLCESDTGIALGVPGTVSLQSGQLLEVLNLPALNGRALALALTARFRLPVSINNDANLFALGESVLGGGKDLLGITLGTGVGAGVVFDGRLYSGKHCSAGEIGSFQYLDGIMEHYCSGQFFWRAGLRGEEAYALALAGDAAALALFERFGEHLGELMVQALLAYDPADIVLGGSVSQAFELFAPAMWRTLTARVPAALLDGLCIRQSTDPNAALIGAAHWFLQHMGTNTHEMAVA
ncbi:ROK family protein [Shewanella sp. JM162201]|uniref:ROK family protein n=1 Tax=Shewanella jiangmenensis TaxID=2837387 RepID=A0ABS5V8E9_9GAMM|nr:ROK family protein [Shewanella jiangmenensis]MBT1446243.1 ROK family protein [Shewanella jiangmenensis]